MLGTFTLVFNPHFERKRSLFTKMEEEQKNHEGENLREILINRFGTLEKAAQVLGKEYTYLTRQVKKDKLNANYLLQIAEQIGVDPAQIRGESQPLKWASEKEEFEYYRQELAAMNKKYIDLLERHVKVLEQITKSE